MTGTPPASTTTTDDGASGNGASGDVDSVRRFVLWALAVARYKVEPLGPTSYTLRVPDDRPNLFHGASTVRFSFQPNGAANSEYVTADSRMFEFVLRELAAAGPYVCSAPASPPDGIHSLSPRLFSAYEVQGGTVSLAGCTFEDRPVLRLTFRRRGKEAETPRLEHEFVGADGRAFDASLCESLGMDELLPAPQMRRTLDEHVAEQWLRVARQSIDRPAEDELIAATIVWLKYASGKLVFSFGEQSAELPFADWATLYAKGVSKPPQFRCAESGVLSRRLATTDDGRITAAEAIGVCEDSGRRCLSHELAACDYSGKRVLRERLATCSVSERRLLKSLMVECPRCRMQVDPAAIEGGVCRACSKLSPVRRELPQLARIFEKHPGLARWRQWGMSETSGHYRLEGRSLWKRLFLVIDKPTLQVRHMATAGRFGRSWKDIAADEQSQLLRGS